MVDSLMVPLGMKAPNFSLPDPSGTVHHLASFADAPAVLVMFLCNHCPYVKHVRHGIAELAADYVPRGLGVVGINANDFERYPEDAPPRMGEFAAEAGWAFPYLYDEGQAVARAYGAACTPDFFLFDGSATLVYRGQMDRSRPGNDVPVSGEDLRRAIDAVLAGQPVQHEQWPSTGCSIKWRSANELA